MLHSCGQSHAHLPKAGSSPCSLSAAHLGGGCWGGFPTWDPLTWAICTPIKVHTCTLPILLGSASLCSFWWRADGYIFRANAKLSILKPWTLGLEVSCFGGGLVFFLNKVAVFLVSGLVLKGKPENMS